MLIDPSGNPSLAFTLYAAECEGDIDTPTGKRNRIIKNLRAMPECMRDDFAVQQEFLKVGLYNPTDEEIKDILEEVNK